MITDYFTIFWLILQMYDISKKGNPPLPRGKEGFQSY